MKKLAWLLLIVGAVEEVSTTNCRAWNTPELYISCQPYSTYFGGWSPGNPDSDHIHFSHSAFNGWTLDIIGQVLGTASNPTLDLLIQATSPSRMSPLSGGPMSINLYEWGLGQASGNFTAVISGTATGNAQPIHFGASYNTANPSYYPQSATPFMYSGAIGPLNYSSSIASDSITLNAHSLIESIWIEPPTFGPGSTEAPGAGYTIHATLSLVPEPSVAALGTSATGLLIYCNKRRRRN